MDRSDFFGSAFDCVCGRRHEITPERVVFAPDAVDVVARSAVAAAGGGPVVVVCDERTRERGADALVAEMPAGRVRQEVVADHAPGAVAPDRWLPAGGPVCDPATMEALRACCREAAALVAVGGGVVSDLVKWTAHELDRPYLCLATAASMNGYSSANVAPAVDGVKVLVRARPPLLVAGDPAVIAAAPWELTSAGLGDLLAKSVSSADWMLNHLLFKDYYCQETVDLIADLEPLYRERPHAVVAREPAAIAAIFEALLLTGTGMTMAGSSAPASGAEHLPSHTLDMLAMRDGHPHDLHGRQVGVGTVLAAALYEEIMALPTLDPRLPSLALDEAWWGTLAPAVAAQVAGKAALRERAAARLRDPVWWDECRRRIGPILRAPATIRACLRDAGAAWRAEDILVDRATLAEVLRHCHEIRTRFTVLDVAAMVGILPDAAADLVARWT